MTASSFEATSLPPLRFPKDQGWRSDRTFVSPERQAWSCDVDGGRVKIELSGPIQFDQGYSRILRMGQDAYFRLEDQREGHQVTLWAEAEANGRPRYTLKDNGALEAIDTDRHLWLARTLGAILRESGVLADDLIRDTWTRAGHPGVRELIASLESEYVMGLYYHRYFELLPLTDRACEATLAQLTGGIRSDYVRAMSLSAYVQQHLGRSSAHPAFLKSLAAIRSDACRAQVLVAALETDGISRTGLFTVFEGVDLIESDHEACRVLAAVDHTLLEDEKTGSAFLRTVRHRRSLVETARVLRLLD